MPARSTSLPRLLTRARLEALSQSGDRELLERFTASGDEAAFAALLDRHGPMLLALCRRLLSDAHLADDVVQATFLVLARKAGTVRRRDSLASWLYGVAQRLARQARLAEAARLRREKRVARGEAARGEPGWDDLLHVLDDELHRLPDRYRAPLLLCYLQGRTQDEAAKQLGWSLSTLRRRLEAGRDLLRGRMTRRGATLGAGLVAGVLVPAARATLTPELRQAVLTAARAGADGAALPASVVVLAGGGLRLATATRLAVWSVFAVAAAVLLAGAVWQTGSASDAQPPAVEAAAPTGTSAPGQDRFDAELPRGAVARLGTVAFRHGRVVWGEGLAFTPDGKCLISSGGGWVRRWDLATGRALVNLGDGWRAGVGGTDRATADGRTARIGVDVPLQTGGIAWQCTEYDLQTGRERRSYRLDFPRDGGAHALPSYLSPDGNTYAELSHDGKVTLWNATDGTVTHQFKPAAGQYTALTFAPDSKTVLVGDDRQGVHVFDVAGGRELRSLRFDHDHAVTRLAVSPDGRWLVTSSGQKGSNPSIWPHDHFLRLWSLERGTPVRTLDFPEDGGILSLAFTPDSRTVLAGLRGWRTGSQAAVRSWDVASGKPGRAWTDDPTIGLTVTVSPDGKTLATLSQDGVIRLWDLASGRERHPREASPCALDAVGFRPDGKTLLTFGQDSALRAWDGATGRPLGRPRSCERGLQSLFTGGARGLLTTFNRDDGVTLTRLHDPQTGKLLLERPGSRPVVSPDGQRLAVYGKDFRVRVFDVASGKGIRTLDPPAGKDRKEGPHAVPRGFTADGQGLVLQGQTVSVWDLRTGKETSSWSLRTNHVYEKPADPARNSWERIEAVAVSPDGRQIAFSVLKDRPPQPGAQDWFCRLTVLETATGKVLQQIDVDGETVAALAFSPDGKRLAVGGAWTVRLWDVDTGRSAGPFEGHRGPITALAFSPDGRRLASASGDSTVLIWDVGR
jgi:RNA polymerase sigma factor (sigma-70 family)